MQKGVGLIVKTSLSFFWMATHNSARIVLSVYIEMSLHTSNIAFMLHSEVRCPRLLNTGNEDTKMRVIKVSKVFLIHFSVSTE